MKFTYTNEVPCSDETLKLYIAAGIHNKQLSIERMKSALESSTLLMCCYDNKRLIGIVRGITDFHWIAHISHLAVHPDYQNKGIGNELLTRVKAELGDGVALMVHSDSKAKEFYQKLGFEEYGGIYRIPRKK